MRSLVFFIVVAVALPLFSCSQAPEEAEDVSISGTLYAVAVKSESAPRDENREEIVFCGDDIVSFNLTTREMVFTDAVSKMLLFEIMSLEVPLKLLIDNHLLFEATAISPLSSRIYDDWSFYSDYPDHPEDAKYYLADGYPPLQSVSQADIHGQAREKNVRKRKKEWDTFVSYLSDACKIVGE